MTITGVPSTRRPRVAVIDNYDSFTYNLVHHVAEMGALPRCSATTRSPSPNSPGTTCC